MIPNDFRFKTPQQVHQAIWPDVYFYDRQWDIINGFKRAVEIDVVAGNELGKDFVFGFICPVFFLFPWVFFAEDYWGKVEATRRPGPKTWHNDPHTRRILTTSVKEEHLKVLWGEIGRFVRTAKPLGGKTLRDVIAITDMEVRFQWEKEASGTNVLNYLRGQVVNKENNGQGMAGHHAAYTAGIGDEASGLVTMIHDQWLGWTKKRAYFGNPFDCNNHWRKNYKTARNCPNGELLDENGRVLIKAIQIKAEHSPNVRLGLAEKKNGKTPSDDVLVPGVISYGRYIERRNPKILDKRQQTIKLDAEFYVGDEDRLLPIEWLDAAEAFADRIDRLNLRNFNKGLRYMGVDVGAGGDDTCWCVIDSIGIIALRSQKTSDTNQISGITKEMMREHDVPAERVIFDLGGGGQFVAQRMRANGDNVRATGFGKAPKMELKRSKTQFDERREQEEDQYAYLNRRSEMAYDLRSLLELSPWDAEAEKPGAVAYYVDVNGKAWGYNARSWNGTRDGFGLPARMCDELRRQCEPIPMTWDGEDRFKLIPKDNPKNKDDPNTFKALIGRSPDQFDAWCLAVFGMTHKPTRSHAGAG